MFRVCRWPYVGCLCFVFVVCVCRCTVVLGFALVLEGACVSAAFTMKVLGGCTDLGHSSNFDYKDYE